MPAKYPVRKLIFVLSCLLLTACATPNASIQNSGEAGFISGDGTATFLKLEDRKSAPELFALDFNGKEIDLKNYKNKVIVLNVWGSWCGPCRQEMPVFARLQRTEADVLFLFINQGESAQDVQAYLRGTQLPVRGVWLDLTSELGPAVGVAGLPATLFVNSDGRIVERHFGVLSEPALRARLRALREAS